MIFDPQEHSLIMMSPYKITYRMAIKIHNSIDWSNRFIEQPSDIWENVYIPANTFTFLSSQCEVSCLGLQSFRNFEIIAVIFDKSDGSFEEFKNYQQMNIAVFTSNSIGILSNGILIGYDNTSFLNKEFSQFCIRLRHDKVGIIEIF